MANEISGVYRHMVGLGLGALAHANWLAAYDNIDNEYSPQLSVLQAAHAGEILIKARIAQEHPLLIFEQLPKALPDEAPLSLQRLVEGGRTYQFFDLPDRLWAITGIKLPAIEHYRTYGRLRNCIQHFTVPPEVDVPTEAIRFIYEVIAPFINMCWGLYAIDYNEDHEPYVYLVSTLISRGVRFLVSPRMMETFEWIELNWPSDDASYRRDMETRFAAARAG